MDEVAGRLVLLNCLYPGGLESSEVGVRAVVVHVRVEEAPARQAYDDALVVAQLQVPNTVVPSACPEPMTMPVPALGHRLVASAQSAQVSPVSVGAQEARRKCYVDAHSEAVAGCSRVIDQ